MSCGKWFPQVAPFVSEWDVLARCHDVQELNSLIFMLLSECERWE